MNSHFDSFNSTLRPLPLESTINSIAYRVVRTVADSLVAISGAVARVVCIHRHSSSQHVTYERGSSLRLLHGLWAYSSERQQRWKEGH